MRVAAELVNPEESVLRLDWIPWDRTIQPPAGLTDTQQGWFWNVLRASFFDQTEMQGYLPITSNLWSIAGAKRRDFFESHKSGLLACFEVRKVGGKEVIYFPPLVESIRKQWKRLRSKKGFDSTFPTYSQASTEGAGASPSHSQSDFVFDSEVQSQKPTKQQKKNNASGSHGYTEADFMERDTRLMAQAQREFNSKFYGEGAVGSRAPEWIFDERKVLEWICRRAGVTIKRALELEQKISEWPDRVPEQYVTCKQHPNSGLTQFGTCWECCKQPANSAAGD